MTFRVSWRSDFTIQVAQRKIWEVEECLRLKPISRAIMPTTAQTVVYRKYPTPHWLPSYSTGRGWVFFAEHSTEGWTSLSGYYKTFFDWKRGWDGELNYYLCFDCLFLNKVVVQLSRTLTFIHLKAKTYEILLRPIHLKTRFSFAHFRVEPTQLTFIILGASMAALALMILVVAFLATGSTRHTVYRSSFGRTSGRIGKQIRSSPIQHINVCVWYSMFQGAWSS